MPVYFDSTADAVGWISGGPVGQSIESICFCGLGLVKANNGSGNQHLVLASHDGVSTSIGLVWRGSADNMYVFSIGTSVAFASRPALNTPFFWYLQCAGSGADQVTAGWAYLDSSAFVTQSVTLDAAAAGGTIASTAFGGNGAVFLNGELAAVRAWTTTLTTTELDAERYTMFPQKLTTAMGYLPLWDASTYRVDASGNGFDLDDLTGVGLTVPSNGTEGFPVRIRSRRAGRAVPYAAPTAAYPAWFTQARIVRARGA